MEDGVLQDVTCVRRGRAAHTCLLVNKVSGRAALGQKALLVRGAWGDAGQGRGVLGTTLPCVLRDFM